MSSDNTYGRVEIAQKEQSYNNATPLRPLYPEEEEKARKAVRKSWEFACVLSFCELFRQNLNFPSFAASELETGLVYPQNHVLLNTIMWSLLFNKNRVQDMGIKKCISSNPDGWIPFLEELTAVRGSDMFKTDPLKFCSYYQLHAVDRTILLFALCTWKLEMDYYLLEKARKRSLEELRIEPIGFDAKDSAYYHITNQRDSYIFTENVASLERTGLDKDGKIRRRTPNLAENVEIDIKITEELPNEPERPDDSGWDVITTTLKELEDLITKLKKTKDSHQKELAKYIKEEIYPYALQKYQAEEKASIKRARAAIVPMKRSSRIQSIEEQKKIDAQLAEIKRQEEEKKRELELIILEEEREREEALEREERIRRREEARLEKIRAREERAEEMRIEKEKRAAYLEWQKKEHEDALSRQKAEQEAMAQKVALRLAQQQQQQQQQQPIITQPNTVVVSPPVQSMMVQTPTASVVHQKPTYNNTPSFQNNTSEGMNSQEPFPNKRIKTNDNTIVHVVNVGNHNNQQQQQQ